MTTKITNALCALMLLGCGGGEDSSPATRDEAISACLDWIGTVETKFSECLGTNAAERDARIAAGQAECPGEVEAEEPRCWRNMVDAYLTCADHAAERSCDELCSNGICYVPCGYGCPPPMPE